MEEASFDDDFQFLVSAFDLVEGVADGIASREENADTAMAVDFRFAEETELDARLFEHMLEVTEFILGGITFDDDGLGGRWTVETDLRDRKIEDGSGMKGKLRQVL